MLVTMCKFSGWYLVYEIVSSVILAATGWGLAFSGF